MEGQPLITLTPFCPVRVFLLDFFMYYVLVPFMTLSRRIAAPANSNEPTGHNAQDVRDALARRAAREARQRARQAQLRLLLLIGMDIAASLKRK
jgi:hypothetical protein